MSTLLFTEEPRGGGYRNKLVKTFTRVGDGWTVSSYDKAYTFDAAPVHFDNIYQLSDLLFELEGDPYACLVRADPIEDCHGIRRALVDDPAKGPATLRANPAGLSWVMLDIDAVPVASHGYTTMDQRLQHLVDMLPGEFGQATCHYQWSSSAGTKGWDTLSAHLWFFLDQPWFCRDLHQRFHSGDFKNVGVDPSPFTANQIHYTAAPIFIGGADPLGSSRSGLVVKDRDTVALRDWIKEPEPIREFTPRQHYDRFGLRARLIIRAWQYGASFA